MTAQPPSVTLVPLTTDNLPSLLEAAVADADPLEVMPAVAGPPGWTPERRRAFVEFHRGRALHPTRPIEHTYLITDDGRVVGAARLQPDGDAVEAGIWIGRSHRGRGIGTVVAGQLRDIAARLGAHRLTAVTTADNAAAQRLVHAGAHHTLTEGDEVTGTTELR
ncbi:GNAT family N-acetyltransferase [Nocardia brevicatena]|uniref:GNAT family N-acetyltransferase n=1 Tax=Nocardia brevicatena TaxID=37327 RepID=UPI00031A1A1A|nr:GNAT family N-acetyltransferase [Nocardia brevicatena]